MWVICEGFEVGEARSVDGDGGGARGVAGDGAAGRAAAAGGNQGADGAPRRAVRGGQPQPQGRGLHAAPRRRRPPRRRGPVHLLLRLRGTPTLRYLVSRPLVLTASRRAWQWQVEIAFASLELCVVLDMQQGSPSLYVPVTTRLLFAFSDWHSCSNFLVKGEKVAITFLF